MMKKILSILLSVTAAVTLAACACNTTTSPSPSAMATPLASVMPSPDASPSIMPSESPAASPEESPSGSSATGTGVDMEAIRMEVEKLSEVKTASVAALGDTALVGLAFDDAYQGTLTARITEMVTEKVQAADTAIKTVKVTADETLVADIEALSKQLTEASDPTSMQEDFDALAKSIEPA